MTDGPNHARRAEELRAIAEKVAKRQTLTESDLSWIAFALGVAYRLELELDLKRK